MIDIHQFYWANEDQGGGFAKQLIPLDLTQ